MTTAPTPLRYEGEGAFSSPPGFRARCDREFIIGQMYRMEERLDRSSASHNHEFAWLADAWASLPEDLADLYPSPEHLRKRALIQAGWYHETIIDVGAKAGALRVAADYRARNEFLLIIVRGSIIIVREAKSQSKYGPNRMSNEDFQASKTAIMEIIAEMIGVKPETFSKKLRSQNEPDHL